MNTKTQHGQKDEGNQVSRNKEVDELDSLILVVVAALAAMPAPVKFSFRHSLHS